MVMIQVQKVDVTSVIWIDSLRNRRVVIHPKAEKMVTIPRNSSSCFPWLSGYHGLPDGRANCSVWVASEQWSPSWNVKCWRFEAFRGMEGTFTVPPLLGCRVRLHLHVPPLGNRWYCKEKFIASLLKKNIHFLQGNILYFLKCFLQFQQVFFWCLDHRAM